jgi:hypothetical protein
VVDEDTGARSRAGDRVRCPIASAAVARAGTPPGTAPGSKWVAFNAIAEHLDYGRRYTTRINQSQRSFVDTSLKQRALELVTAA